MVNLKVKWCDERLTAVMNEIVGSVTKRNTRKAEKQQQCISSTNNEEEVRYRKRMYCRFLSSMIKINFRFQVLVRKRKKQSTMS